MGRIALSMPMNMAACVLLKVTDIKHPGILGISSLCRWLSAHDT